MARSLNRAQLIGNLTRDPELRYTPNGTAVCSFGIATNRNWTTPSGEKKDEAEFHNIVAWNKLAELCSQFLVKGGKVFVEGRLATRSWKAQDGTQRTRTEIVISDMLLLGEKKTGVREEETVKDEKDESKEGEEEKPVEEESTPVKQAGSDSDESSAPKESEEEVAPEDIPF